jgi:hypothetical protein
LLQNPFGIRPRIFEPPDVGCHRMNNHPHFVAMSGLLR